MKILTEAVSLSLLNMELKRNDLIVLRRVCSQVGGANPSGARSVTDKFINLIDARDPSIQADAALLPVADPGAMIVFAD